MPDTTVDIQKFVCLLLRQSKKMKSIEENINYYFKNKKLLETALTHCSYASENKTEHNQRLEFLGDAVLELVMSEYLYENHKDYDEGSLSRLRSSIVSEKPLAIAADKIGVDDFVLLGVGERASGGASKFSVLSDTLESIFAAVYLDGGLEEARRVILFVMQEVMNNPKELLSDYKTALQEYLFRNGNVKVEYKIVSVTGPAHDSVFSCQVYCNGKLLGDGNGRNKKSAEQSAAQNAMEKLKLL